ncbi:hypothetical protein [Hoeflea ulvae]|uniref:PAS domain-containing protein n=1 Tax=Hoeflea ulvae TaxID=2983764 RepID=A0ABT3YJ21_9HYPH|nr:hypothetical protein [Hoeflea ulvae]MCY0095730.1 hypothetical protein [Hoeflea ulvae]
MNSHISPMSFELPDSAPERIRAFLTLWHQKADGDMPSAADFDVATLSSDYPLLVRIRLEGPKETLVLDDVAIAERWPFMTPVKDRPLTDFVPEHSKKRVMGAFEETLASGVPNYYETTSWKHDGQCVTLARLVAPLVDGDRRELIALWDVVATA